MKQTESATGKINALALEVMNAVNTGKEDHTKTLQLLQDLQSAIQEVKTLRQG